MTIRVLIIDRSQQMRALLAEIIDGASDLEVIGATGDPIAAHEMIRTLSPDVLTIDLGMPRTDGINALDRLIRSRSLPAIRISALAGSDSMAASKGQETRASGNPARSRIGHGSLSRSHLDGLCDRLRAASGARKDSMATTAVSPAPTFVPSRTGFSSRLLTDRVIAIGASTGGTEAIREVLCALPADMPPIVIVQHMPAAFTPSFARRLDGLSSVTVSEAQGGERLQPGMAYLAPGHSHMRVKKSGGGYVLELSRDDPVNRHRPSVDVLFLSVAEQVRQNAIGVILTGMGKDGARGLLAMHQAGAWNIGQDQASCAVYGMPREAAVIGALDEVATLREISNSILARLRQLDKRTAAG